MTVSRICANYLNGFGELSNARNNSINKNMWAVAKVVSYIATVGILPLLVKIVQIIATKRKDMDAYLPPQQQPNKYSSAPPPIPPCDPDFKDIPEVSSSQLNTKLKRHGMI